MFDVFSLILYSLCHSFLHFLLSKILRVSKNVMAIDQAVKAWFELVVFPRLIALGLPVPPLPELFRQLVANEMTVFVQDIYSPSALANGPAWDAAVWRVYGRLASIRQSARRDAGILNLMTPAHRQISSDTQHRLLANSAHNFIPHNASSDLQAFDTRLEAYINFKDDKLHSLRKELGIRLILVNAICISGRRINLV